MGLDMYLIRKTYLFHNKIKSIEFVSGDNEERVELDYIKLNKIQEIHEGIGYWRKFNALHHWFVENVQQGNDDCKEYDVSLQALSSLYDLIKKILENRNLAMELLPPRDGFFFGSTNIDEWYWEDVEETKQILEELFEAHKRKPESVYICYEYHASW